MNKDYLFPSFNTIAGAGKNGAIVHYRATKKNTKLIKKMIFFYVTLVVNTNMGPQMLHELYVSINLKKKLKIYLPGY